MFNDKYKTTVEEYEKFWNRENIKRPVLNISYKKEGFESYRAPQNLQEKWLDPQYKYNQFKHTVENSGYLAEGIPMHFVNLGPGCLAACVGGGFDLAENTVWFDSKPKILDIDNLPNITFDEKSEMWQYIVNEQLICAADNSHFSITDLGGIMDVVASLRGTNNLLLDLYDAPERVKEISSQVKAAWLKAFDKQVEIVKNANQPYNSWMNIPSEKPWYPLQCDFCYMISPDHFREFVLDDLIEQVNYMPRSIYHLDGVGELPHLDMLLDIPNLSGIQWTAGAGNAPLYDEKWFSLYRKIQDKKKNLVLLGGISQRNLEGAERLIKSVDPTGLYISISCSSREKAEEILEKITRWCE